MRNFIILFIIWTLTSCSTESSQESINQQNSNKPISMVSELNKWYVYGEVEDLNAISNLLEIKKQNQIYFFEGDTLINNIEYKKMYCRQLDSIFYRSWNPVSAPQFNSTFNDVRYKGAMREADNIVYYINENETIEELYADFNINIGDVLNYKWNVNGETVINIDSIAIGQNSILKYRLSNEHYFYEGIGASYGLFNTWQTNARIGGFLNCFSLGDTKIGIDEGFYYPNTNCPEF